MTAAYATPELFAAVTGYLELSAPDDVNGLLQRASEDLDGWLAWPAPIAAGVRIDTTSLTPYQQDCLQRACCLQAAYRLTVGEDDMAEGVPRVANVGPISLTQTAPDRIGPDVKVLIAGSGLLRRSGTAAKPPDPAPWCDPWGDACPPPAAA